MTLIYVCVKPHFLPIIPEVKVHKSERMLHVDGGGYSVVIVLDGCIVVVDWFIVVVVRITSVAVAGSQVVGSSGMAALRKASWVVLIGMSPMGTSHLVDSFVVHSHWLG